MNFAKSIPRPVGRPRQFELNQALDKAIVVFCARGFHATSISDLSEAMGLTTGSLYKAFHDKRAIFLAALERQMNVRLSGLQTILASVPCSRDKLRATLLFYVCSNEAADKANRCLIVSTAVELASFDAAINTLIVEAIQRREKLILDLIHLGQSDGSIPQRVNAEAAARFLLFLLQGFRVVGKIHPLESEMVDAVDAAMMALG